MLEREVGDLDWNSALQTAGCIVVGTIAAGNLTFHLYPEIIGA